MYFHEKWFWKLNTYLVHTIELPNIDMNLDNDWNILDQIE